MKTKTFAVLVAVAGLAILLGLSACGTGNITCKKRAAQQYELCVKGHPGVVFVSRSLYRKAKVGDDYSDSGGHPDVAPHDGFGGGDGGDGDGGGHGGGDGGE